MTDAWDAANQAEILREIGRLDDAERVLRMALQDHPSERRLLLGLAAVLLDARQFKEGLAVCTSAITADPDEELGHRIRGLLLSGRGWHREAIESCHSAVALAPNSSAAALAHSIVLEVAGRMAVAKQAAQRAVELDPWSADAHLQLADVAHRLGDWPTARQAYKEALSLDPSHAAARHDLALLDLERRPDRSLAGLIAAGRLDPTMPQVLGNVTLLCAHLSMRIGAVCFAGVAVPLFVGILVDNDGGPARFARVAAIAVVAVMVVMAGWAARSLPRGTWPIARAAITTNRLLTLIYLALGLCTLVYVVVAMTGLGRLSGVVWVVLIALVIVVLRHGD